MLWTARRGTILFFGAKVAFEIPVMNLLTGEAVWKGFCMFLLRVEIRKQELCDN